MDIHPNPKFSRNENRLSTLILCWLACLIALILTSAFLLKKQELGNERLDTANKLRYESYLLADQLRQSSDDLTRMARTYAATGKSIFEEYFWTILDIREGKIPRPGNYEKIYWDFMMVEKATPPFKEGRAIPLKKLMEKAGFSDNEFRLLIEAQQKSDDLVNLEKIAFHAMKGKFRDQKGDFLIDGEPDPDKARQILFGEDYHKAKIKIMRPINDFLITIDRRTAQTVEEAQRSNEFYHLGLVFVFCGLVVNILLLLISIRRYHKCTLHNHRLIINNKTKEITDRKRAEEALRASEEKTRLLLNSTGEAIYGINLDGNCTFANPACAKILGYENESRLLGKHMHDLIHHTRPDGTPYPVEECLIYQAFREGKGTNIDNEVLWRADGTSFPSEYWSYPIQRNGELVGSVVTFIDITERKRTEEDLKKYRDHLEDEVEKRTLELKNQVAERDVAEEALKQSRDQFRSLVSNIPGITYRCALDKDWTMLYMSPNVDEITGYPASDFTYNSVRTYESIIHREDTEYVDRSVNEAVEAKVPWEIEYRICKKNGDIRWMYEKGIGVTGKDGKVKFLDGFIIDNTDRKQAMEEAQISRVEAEKANEAKSLFLTSMSHELRTPMNSILGFAQLLDSDPAEPLSSSQKENLSHILKSGDHLLELINEILNLSKIESGKLQVSIEDVEMYSVIEEALATVGPMVKKKRVNITCLEKKSNQYVLGDRVRLKQVVMNLLSNAIKYNKKDGTVELGSEEIGTNMLRIWVKDTGPGIPKEKLDELFFPFNRLGAEGMEIEGTGIGLTIAKKLMELMGGKIGVESEVGKGSKFYIDLRKGKVPETETVTEEEAGEKKTPSKPLQKRTLLYLEDNSANLKLVGAILKRRPNIELISAQDAQTGIDLARTHQPDLILLDINLPGMSGFDALKHLRDYEETRSIPVIAVTANAMPRDIEKGKTLGFKEYITKPINVGRFLEVLDKVLKN